MKITHNLEFSYFSEPKIIAEISGNHKGNKREFLKLIKSACLNGADLIKIQTYEPKDITLDKNNKEFFIDKGTWKGKRLWDLYKKACTPFSWHKDAFKIAKKYKKTIFSSPFSIRAVDLLESLDCKIYKLASFEITDLKLIDYIASKKKPIIISTGMASQKEIEMAINTIARYHKKIIILHCVSSYPTNLNQINLQRIDDLKKKFKNYLIGLSDHTDDIISSVAASSYNIVAIEKHYKLDNKSKTTDSSFSITPEQLRKLKNYTSKLFESKKKQPKFVEQTSKKLRRSIYAITNIYKNEKISKNNIDTLRPKIGICASKYFKVINKKAKKNIKAGQPIFDNMLV